MRDGKELVAAGYYQTSAKYRMVGRVPPGKTGKDALYEAEMVGVLKHAAELRRRKEKGPVSSVFKTPGDMERHWEKERRRWVERLGEQSCVDQYVRVYATGEDSLTLTPEEWRSFKAAGGRCAY
jgi:hypothetical protein